MARILDAHDEKTRPTAQDLLADPWIVHLVLPEAQVLLEKTGESSSILDAFAQNVDNVAAV